MANRVKDRVDAGHDRRLATHPPKDEFPKGSSVKDTGQTGRKPGSRNRKKIGR
jgi:hypothetical protein